MSFSEIYNWVSFGGAGQEGKKIEDVFQIAAIL
jgi:hypothetical protein